MRPISQRVKSVIASDYFYTKCARIKDGGCMGRLTMEHALIFAGKQVDEPFAIIPLCEFHHAVNRFQDGGDLQKEKNIWIALNRATDQELEKISKAVNYISLRERLNTKYGKYSF